MSSNEHSWSFVTSEHKLQYETQGFIHLQGVLEPAFLCRLRNAFECAIAKHLPTFEQGNGKHTGKERFDIPSILDQDDVFVDLADISTVFPLLIEILGDDIQLMMVEARLFPPGRTFTPPWHSDLDRMQGIDLGNSINFHAKIHYYPEDLSPDQGCLAFIPGSHRYPADHPRPQIDHRNDSPLVTKIVPKAGDAVLFNPHILHMCLDNQSPRVRKSLIYTYSHFWLKTYPSAVPRDLQRLATTPQRLQLFGIPTEDGLYFGQALRSTSIGEELAKRGRKLASEGKALFGWRKQTSR